MRLSRAILVIADISGYTNFITNREVSLLHAEQIITELLEAVIDGAEFPLVLNKLEGDAALLYAEVGDDPKAAAFDVVRQVRDAFAAFANRLDAVRQQRRHCNCDACSNISNLRLKAFFHEGEIAIKRVRQFEELAGEDVILIHRLLKNSVREREYLLFTQRFHDLVGEALADCSTHVEHADGVGDVQVRMLAPNAPALLRLQSRLRTAAKVEDGTLVIDKAALQAPETLPEPVNTGRFLHLPEAAAAAIPTTQRGGFKSFWQGLFGRARA